MSYNLFTITLPCPRCGWCTSTIHLYGGAGVHHRYMPGELFPCRDAVFALLPCIKCEEQLEEHAGSAIDALHAKGILLGEGYDRKMAIGIMLRSGGGPGHFVESLQEKAGLRHVGPEEAFLNEFYREMGQTTRGEYAIETQDGQFRVWRGHGSYCVDVAVSASFKESWHRLAFGRKEKLHWKEILGAEVLPTKICRAMDMNFVGSECTPLIAAANRRIGAAELESVLWEFYARWGDEQDYNARIKEDLERMAGPHGRR